MTCIYGLIDPRNNRLRYIGRSVSVLNRYKHHCANVYKSEVENTNVDLSKFISELKSQGLRPKLRIYREVDNLDAKTTEREYIDRYNNLNLLNRDSNSKRVKVLIQDRVTLMRKNKTLNCGGIETLI